MKLTLTIHNVGHGSCISLQHDQTAMLWDCGREGRKSPSVFLPDMGVKIIDTLFITNYDEDHISDLADIFRTMTPTRLWRNDSIGAPRLQRLKEEDNNEISSAMAEMLRMIYAYATPAPNFSPYFRPLGVETAAFANSFSESPNDTNNCSLVTFLSCNGTNFVFPGDLECEGWEKLLRKPDFCGQLKDVDYFVASHHGRENGYCKKVFDYCEPRAVIFSDSNIKYATQEMAAAYRQHCSGVSFKGENRQVLSTRKDGDICWPLDFSA